MINSRIKCWEPLSVFIFVIFIEVYIFLISHLPLLKYIEHSIACHLAFTFFHSKSRKKPKHLQKLASLHSLLPFKVLSYLYRL